MRGVVDGISFVPIKENTFLRPTRAPAATTTDDISMKVSAYELKRYATIVENDKVLSARTGVENGL